MQLIPEDPTTVATLKRSRVATWSGEWHEEIKSGHIEEIESGYIEEWSCRRVA